MTHTGGSLCLTEALLAPAPAFVLEQDSARIQRNWVFQSNRLQLTGAGCGYTLACPDTGPVRALTSNQAESGSYVRRGF